MNPDRPKQRGKKREKNRQSKNIPRTIIIMGSPGCQSLFTVSIILYTVWLRSSAVVLSSVLAPLRGFGSICTHGSAHTVWFSLPKWLRSRFMVLSEVVATLTINGSLFLGGSAQTLWFSRRHWLRSVPLVLSCSLAPLIVRDSLFVTGSALFNWFSPSYWLRSL